MDNILNSIQSYGCLPQQAKVARYIQIAQSAPQNWFGQQIAQICRRLVLRSVSFPLDTEVDGIRMRVFLTDNNSEKKYLFMPWRFDLKERELLARSVPRDGVFVDIGANIGIYSLWVAKHLSRKGRIVSFEPNPPAFERLKFNVNANSDLRSPEWPEVICISKGVSDGLGSLPLFLDPNNLGGSSLVITGTRETTVNIEVVTLLSELKRLEIDHIDALKIDIEGAEEKALLPFLENAERTLLPRLLIMERTHSETNQLCSKLLELNYEIQLKTKLNFVFKLRK
jgi:FkbM family methyltransferase